MPTGPRIRHNNDFGVTTDNPLTIGATTFNSAGLVTLPTVAAAHAVVVLDPKKVSGEPEIVVVTAHTAAATVATITRAQYGTLARSHPVGTAWAHVPVDEDYIEILTAATRPSNPYEGQFIFETDTNKLVGFGGVDWAPRDAGGQLGYAQVTSSQTGITSMVDLTGLTTTVTVGTGRRVKITGYGPQFARTAGTVNYVNFSIWEGGTQLTLITLSINNNFGGGTVQCVLTPSVGVHTYKLRAETDGTVSQASAALYAAFILVEDIGAA